MCGRYTHLFTWRQLHRLMSLTLPESTITPRYNVAPTQAAPVVRRTDAGERTLAFLRWGLVPFWAKDPSIGAALINARAETVAAKPSFRAAFRSRRCAVPASGFYEWRKAQGREPKQPHYITPADADLFVFAGLWERWEPPEGGRVESFAIVTTGANERMAPVHDRMPAILGSDDLDPWLDPRTDAARAGALLRPCDPERLRIAPVSTRVNNPRHDDALCIAPG